MDPVGLAYPSQIEGEITRRIAELVRVVDLEKATVRTLQRELELRLGRDLSDHRGFIRTQVRVGATSCALVDDGNAKRGFQLSSSSELERRSTACTEKGIAKRARITSEAKIWFFNARVALDDAPMKRKLTVFDFT